MRRNVAVACFLALAGCSSQSAADRPLGEPESTTSASPSEVGGRCALDFAVAGQHGATSSESLSETLGSCGSLSEWSDAYFRFISPSSFEAAEAVRELCESTDAFSASGPVCEEARTSGLP